MAQQKNNLASFLGNTLNFNIDENMDFIETSDIKALGFFSNL